MATTKRISSGQYADQQLHEDRVVEMTGQSRGLNNREKLVYYKEEKKLTLTLFRFGGLNFVLLLLR